MHHQCTHFHRIYADVCDMSWQIQLDHKNGQAKVLATCVKRNGKSAQVGNVHARHRAQSWSQDSPQVWTFAVSWPVPSSLADMHAYTQLSNCMHTPTRVVSACSRERMPFAPKLEHQRTGSHVCQVGTPSPRARHRHHLFPPCQSGHQRTIW